MPVDLGFCVKKALQKFAREEEEEIKKKTTKEIFGKSSEV